MFRWDRLLILLTVFTLNPHSDLRGQSSEAKSTKPPFRYKLTAAALSSPDRKQLQVILEIGDEFELYSAAPHPFLTPLKLELLDSEYRIIPSTVNYPKGIVRSFPELPDLDHSAYRGKVKFQVACGSEDVPEFVRLSFQGTNRRHMH